MEKTNEIYQKKFKITPNLAKEFQIMWDGFKKMRQKTKNYKNSSPSARVRHSGKSVLKISLFSHIVFCSRVPLFPECCTQGRGSSATKRWKGH
jgi:hypothetical protein